MEDNQTVYIMFAPTVYDPMTRYKSVYINGPQDCSKTTRVIKLFRIFYMIVFLTPTFKLARKMK